MNEETNQTAGLKIVLAFLIIMGICLLAQLVGFEIGNIIQDHVYEKCHGNEMCILLHGKNSTGCTYLVLSDGTKGVSCPHG